MLNAAPNGQEGNRFGFVTGKKVGGAVERNRARRLIREAVRLKLPLLKPGYDLVWVARPSINEADFTAVQAAIDEALRCKQAGETKNILFNLSGHGFFDLSAYDKYLAGELEDFEYPVDAVQAALAGLPSVAE